MKIFRSREVKVAAALILLFVISSFLSRRYAGGLVAFRELAGGWSVLAYIAITMADVLLAVASIVPLIPVAAAIWGPFWAGTYTAIGWTLGSMLAFWLSRRYGERFICRVFRFCQISGYKKFLPRRRLFWLMVLARIFLPIDLISYAVGVFTSMSYVSFFFSSLIGLAIFSYLYAYGSGLPLGVQAFLGICVLALVLSFYRQGRQRYLAWLKEYRE